MVHIAHDNIQIGVLCVVQIIDGPALQQVKILPEFRNHAGLYIDDLCIAEPLLQQCGEHLGGLARFYQLPVDKALLFVIGKRGLPSGSFLFFRPVSPCFDISLASPPSYTANFTTTDKK